MSTHVAPPDELGPSSAEAQWVIEGPNSGGIAGWWLYRGHMYWFRNEGSSGSVQRGIPVQDWLGIHADSQPAIAAVLRERDG